MVVAFDGDSTMTRLRGKRALQLNDDMASRRHLTFTVAEKPWLMPPDLQHMAVERANSFNILCVLEF